MAIDGSSPHAWGTLAAPLALLGLMRFIPTCVGNSIVAVYRALRFTVHPHMRGELICAPWLLRRDIGSSPHAWGTRSRPVICWWRMRFIPTCVGNSKTLAGFIVTRPVHPHMRGELISNRGRGRGDYGSSPHAWGTPRSLRRLRLPDRFIPTCVGNSKFRCTIHL